MHAVHLLAANEILLILQPPPPPSIHTQYWLGQQNASVDLWEKDSPCEHGILCFPVGLMFIILFLM